MRMQWCEYMSLSKCTVVAFKYNYNYIVCFVVFLRIALVLTRSAHNSDPNQLMCHVAHRDLSCRVVSVFPLTSCLSSCLVSCHSSNSHVMHVISHIVSILGSPRLFAVVSRRLVSSHVSSCQIMSRVVSRVHLASSHVISCVMVCRVISRRAVPCIMSCQVMACGTSRLASRRLFL